MTEQKSIETIGKNIHEKTLGEQVSVFKTDYWQGRLIEWVMKDPDFKVDLFRFVDVLPTLTSPAQVSSHINEYLLKRNRTLPAAISTALKAATSPLTSKLAAMTIKRQVSSLAERFIVGQDAASSIKTLQSLWNQGFAFTIDLLGEETLSNQEADAYLARCHDLLDNLQGSITLWQQNCVLESGLNGSVPRGNISLKLSALTAHMKAESPQYVVDELKHKLNPIFEKAVEKNYFINLDLESWKTHEITYKFFEEMLLEPKFRDYPHFGVVVQAYLKKSGEDLERLKALATKRNAPVTVRLVKGAYWDYEVVLARQHGYQCPVFEQKAQTDANYEKLSRYLLENYKLLNPAFGSHNIRSLAYAMHSADKLNVPKEAVEFQMLYGMAEPERKVLCQMERRVRLYCPVGELLPGMAYLVRRLLENTSNEGFVKLKHHNQVDIEALMQDPAEKIQLQAEQSGTGFKNCALTDFSENSSRGNFESALRRLKEAQLLKSAPVLNGEIQTKGEFHDVLSPNNFDTKLGEVVWSDKVLAEKAVNNAHEAFLDWKNQTIEGRANLLKKLSAILERDRFDLCALMIQEVGKTWAEADADLAEAVDFCNYYAGQALLELSPQKIGNVFGEENILSFEGRGPTVVIAPWNFPLAILCGMTVAPLVSGNTVIMKPAEQSSLIAYAFYKKIIEAGFPKETVQFLPGNGEVVGPALVEHPKVAQIAFTGSKKVGHSIYLSAAKVQSGQLQMKRVICEMGGKNAIVVDEDADLDEAVSGVLKSAFGFAGQKCSACSRVVVLERVYEHFKERLLGAVASLNQFSSDNPASDLGPVIDKESFDRLNAIVSGQVDKAERLFVGTAASAGYFVPPAIFEVYDAEHMLMQSEFFGPILAIMKVKNLKEAMGVVNSTEFALTAGLYSRSPSNIELVKTELNVGNLYINQPCTGAVVARQPFGGSKMSGTGIKAGGPGYLKHFVNERCTTENTMRRGFTPELG